MSRIRPLILAASLVLLVSAPAADTLAQPASSASPSLADTLNWLVGFLPFATEAKSGGKLDMAIAANLRVSGCEVVLTEYASWYDRNSRPQFQKSTTTYQFSLGDIDPSSITVKSDNSSPPAIYVDLRTRGGSPTIATDFPLTPRTSAAAIGSFVDRASAQRVVKAVKHAAQLCASSQPF